VDPHGPAARVGRDGALSLRFERRGAATVLAGCRSVLPLQVLAPLALDGAAAVVSILNPTGSVLGGDHLRIDVRAEPDAHAVLTTPSATRVHRTAGPAAEQDVDLTVGTRAIVEWLPDHTIPHADSSFRQTIRARVGAEATLLVVDAFAAGRVARGEQFAFRRLESALTIVDDDGWLLHDRFVLAGGCGFAGVGFCEGAPYFATIAVVAPAPVTALTRAVTAAAAGGAARVGVGVLRRRGVLVRCLADSAPDLSFAIRRIWDAIRTEALGVAALELRKL
jgi:urease accessory protein